MLSGEDRPQGERLSRFAYVTLATLDAIRSNVEFKHQATALAIYLGLADLASRRHMGSRREGLELSRREVARSAGVTPDTVDDYVPILEGAGVLETVRDRRQGKVHLPNLWTLVEPDGGSRTIPPPSGITPLPLAEPLRQGGGASPNVRKKGEETEEEEETHAPSSYSEDVERLCLLFSDLARQRTETPEASPRHRVTGA